MSRLSPQEVVEFLARNQLLRKSQLETIAGEVGTFHSAEQLTEELVQRGWLTTYQQTHLLSGQGNKLILGPYRLVEPLGAGGMGMVFKGWHPRLDRIVALKLIHTNPFTFRPEIITRFHREARANAKLQHPNLVVLFDADEVDDTHYIAMEFVNGINLEKMVRQNGPLPIKQACDYIRQAALGLQHAAECGLVHRDIKPSNILVALTTTASQRSSFQLKRPDLVTAPDVEVAVDPNASRTNAPWGAIKILDMGLARLLKSMEAHDSNHAAPLTKAGSLLGTPDFISPEQARDARSVDVRSDLYSLGCTFYFLLTGQPPFHGGNTIQKLARHETEPPHPIRELRPQIPTFVARVIERLLAKKPEDRFQTPHELADVLAEYLSLDEESHLSVRDTPSAPLAVRAEGFDSVHECDRSAAPTEVLPEFQKRVDGGDLRQP